MREESDVDQNQSDDGDTETSPTKSPTTPKSVKSKNSSGKFSSVQLQVDSLAGISQAEWVLSLVLYEWLLRTVTILFHNPRDSGYRTSSGWVPLFNSTKPLMTSSRTVFNQPTWGQGSPAPRACSWESLFTPRTQCCGPVMGLFINSTGS